MTTNQKMKKLREASNMTQSDMAKKMNIAINTYGRLERGETHMSERRLKQVSEIFNTDAAKILSTPTDRIVLLVTENTVTESESTLNTINYYGNGELQVQNEKLQLILDGKEKELTEKEKLLVEKDKLLAAKDEQIALLHELLKQLQHK
ncbi:helix-turn-helix domain-containing protein [Conchiformibius steedae]|uniref:XRE family transcriptional regulator n=1 Tax=Conchiformibius steedae TaxID=153493 RepID=A0A3P2A0C7_9NEIS|nr:helix-turn-helix transcriptional regulator [Conchiformibius steedae]RRD88749.1 XRE family transcriptional regulator [Conchiformibius steedae]